MRLLTDAEVDLDPNDNLKAALRATESARRRLNRCTAWLRRARDRVMEVERATHRPAPGATASRDTSR